MSVVRSALAAAELTVAVVGLAVAVSRHPLVRAGVRAAPHLMSPAMKEAATERALDMAYRAGVAARRIVPRSLIG